MQKESNRASNYVNWSQMRWSFPKRRPTLCLVDGESVTCYRNRNLVWCWCYWAFYEEFFHVTMTLFAMLSCKNARPGEPSCQGRLQHHRVLKIEFTPFSDASRRRRNCQWVEALLDAAGRANRIAADKGWKNSARNGALGVVFCLLKAKTQTTTRLTSYYCEFVCFSVRP